MEQKADYARVRVLHTSPDTPAVDIYIDGAKAIGQLTYGQVSDYITLSADRHQLGVFPVGMSAPGDAFMVAHLQKLRPEDLTLAIVGVRKDLQVATLEDSVPQPGPGQAKMRVFHASPDAPALAVDTSAAPHLFPLVSFTEVTDYKDVQARTIDMRLRRSSSYTEVLLTLSDYTLVADREYTFVVLGLVDGQPHLTLMPLVREVIRCPT